MHSLFILLQISNLIISYCVVNDISASSLRKRPTGVVGRDLVIVRIHITFVRFRSCRISWLVSSVAHEVITRYTLVVLIDDIHVLSFAHFCVIVCSRCYSAPLGFANVLEHNIRSWWLDETIHQDVGKLLHSQVRIWRQIAVIPCSEVP